MKINQPAALTIARELLREYNGNWDDVRRSGVRQADGVILVPATRSGTGRRQRTRAAGK